MRSAAALSVILALLAAPVPSHGQQPGKIYRTGFLGSGPPASADTTPQHCPIKGGRNWQAFVEGLREHGYIPGQNLVIECRWTEGREERAPALAAELVSLKPDLIVAVASANTLATKQATSTIPIVMVNVPDPVERGLVASLGHPGGNITGLTYTAGVEIVGKHLQLLKEVVPRVSRVAVLRYLSVLPSPSYRREMEAAARGLGLTLQFYDVQAPEELEGAFAAMTKARAEALFVVPSPFLSLHRRRIVDLAAQTRLPAMYPGREYVEAEGLMAYAVDEPATFRRLGFYVDKILNRANPAALPVDQPTKFELLIGLKTAKTLGLTIPQSLLLRADEVIQ